jgi:hypothetical protein
MMKKGLLLNQSFFVCVIFIMFIHLPGCYMTRVASPIEITTSDKCMIHCQDSKYFIENVIISDGVLSGKLKYADAGLSGKLNFDDFGLSGKPDHERGKSTALKLHIYLISDNNLTLNNSLLSFPVSDITKTTLTIHAPLKTIALRICISAGSFLCLCALGYLL